MIKPVTAAIILFAAAFTLAAQPLVYKVEFNPLNRALIYFRSPVTDYSSSLSKDKKTVTISLPYKGKTKNSTTKTSSGIINSVSVSQTADSLIVRATFLEPRGYNAYFLPYSGILSIEAFRWNELSKAEDNYRQGLLAFESGVMAEARSYFMKAAKQDHPNANFFCGLLAIMEEEFQDAEGYLLKAENLKTNIPDVYAALSYIYDMKNDSKKAGQYKNKFRSATGINVIREIPSNYFSQSNDDSEDEPTSLLDEAAADTIAPDTTVKDTARGGTYIKTSNDSLAIPTGEPGPENSFIPEWMNSYAFYAVVTGMVFIAILVSSYIKWRNNKIKYLQYKEKDKKKSDRFKDSLKKAGSTIAQKPGKEGHRPGTKPPPAAVSQLANVYRKHENTATVPVTPAPVTAEPEKLPEKKPDTAAEKAPETESAAKKEKKRESLDEQFEKLAGLIETELNRDKGSESLVIESDEPEAPEPPPAPPINPSLQLALHLQEEQKKLREKSIGSLDAEEIPGDVRKLSEFARKLGIDKGSVETKLAISRLESDKKQIDELYQKFVQEKKDRKK